MNIIRSKLLTGLGINGAVALALLTAIALSSPADAAQSIGQIAGRINSDITQLPTLIGTFAMIAGIVLAAAGLFKLKQWGEDSQRNPLKPAAIMLVAGAGLVAVPAVLGVGVMSIFGDINGVTSGASQFVR